MNLEQSILNGIKNGKLTFRTNRDIFFELNLKPSSKSAFKAALDSLCDRGLIMRDREGGYCTPEQAGAFVGTVQGSDRGFAFIIPENGDKDFFVPARAVNGAYNGDTVLAARVRGTEDEAYIVKILGRANKNIVGTLDKNKRAAYVVPDNPREPEIFIPLSLTGGGKNGDKVVCSITSYPHGKAPGGKVIEVLGEGGYLDVEETSIIRTYSLEEEFPSAVLAEAAKAAAEKIELSNRKDLRDVLIFTIDGADTRDIDDGVSLSVDGETFILGVHIADVSHYVKYGSRLDKNAYGRGTSVYFPDRVLPMLPKELSNGACSLNEGEDRYALSCIMRFDKNGKRLDCEICESVINSRHKMTYSDVTAICEGNEELCDKFSDIRETVENMQRLCLILEARRKKLGSVNMDIKEAHIYVNDGGEIVIPPCEQTISQRIIEQFMVSANEAVAEFLSAKKAPCLYRVHEIPAPEKAATFLAFIGELGAPARFDTENPKPADFQKILNASADKPYYSVINKVMLRTMRKARYSEENFGHFGLASECYCHFTSPIRRYPDLFVHRALKEILKGGSAEKYSRSAHDAGIDCSERERIADEAERKVDDLYKLAYMSDRLGEEYPATISGVTSFGIFCELDNSIEGLIPLEDLPPDGYEFFEEKFLLKGRKHSYKLGDAVNVKVVACDLGKLRVIFGLCATRQ